MNVKCDGTCGREFLKGTLIRVTTSKQGGSYFCKECCDEYINRAERAEAHVKRLLNEWAHDEACWRSIANNVHDSKFVKEFASARVTSIGRGLEPGGYLLEEESE